MSDAPLIKFDCPECQKPLRIPAKLAGERGRCPNCKQFLTIPPPMLEEIEPESRPARRRSSPLPWILAAVGGVAFLAVLGVAVMLLLYLRASQRNAASAEQMKALSEVRVAREDASRQGTEAGPPAPTKLLPKSTGSTEAPKPTPTPTAPAAKKKLTLADFVGKWEGVGGSTKIEIEVKSDGSLIWGVIEGSDGIFGFSVAGGPPPWTLFVQNRQISISYDEKQGNLVAKLPNNAELKLVRK